MPMFFRFHRLFLPALLMSAILVAPATAFGFQKLKIGNGALLRKMFGGKEDEPEKASAKEDARKPAPAPQARDTDKRAPWYDFEAHRQNSRPNPLSRESLDEARQRLEEDTRKLQQELRSKFQSPFKGSSEEEPNEPTPRNTQPRSSLNSVLDQHSAGQPRQPGGWDQQYQRFADPRSLGPQNQPRIRPEDRNPIAARPQNPNTLPPASQPPTAEPSSEPPMVISGGPGFGIQGNPLPAGGIQVSRVAPGSVADAIGVQPGDVLENFAGLQLESLEEIDAVTNVLKTDDQFELALRRSGKPLTKTISGSDVLKASRSAPQRPAAPVIAAPEPARHLNNSALPLSLQPSPALTAEQPGIATTVRTQEIQRLQQQIEQQQRLIQQLKSQLKATPASAPRPILSQPPQTQPPQAQPPQTRLAPPTQPGTTAPSEISELELDLEPPR